MKTVVILPVAAKGLHRQRSKAEHILTKIEAYAASPESQANNVRMLAGSTAKRLPIGDFRVIFEETETEIIVSKIGPRGSVYQQEPDAMNVRYIITPKGEELAILPRAEFEALTESVEHGRDVAAYQMGRLPGLSAEETRAFVAAASPLAFWRKYRGMTQSALAELVGVTQGYLSDVENGRRDGPVELWLKLSRALDLPIEALVDGD